MLQLIFGGVISSECLVMVHGRSIRNVPNNQMPPTSDTDKSEEEEGEEENLWLKTGVIGYRLTVLICTSHDFLASCLIQQHVHFSK